jgi:hypothetical protein
LFGKGAAEASPRWELKRTAAARRSFCNLQLQLQAIHGSTCSQFVQVPVPCSTAMVLMVAAGLVVRVFPQISRLVSLFLSMFVLIAQASLTLFIV